MACGANQTAQVYIDGVEHTGVAVAGSWTPKLNAPAQAQVTIPMETDAGDCGVPLMITLDDDEIVFHGRILNTELSADKDGGTVVYNAQDDMELWQWRPVRDDDCDFSKPTIITDYLYGPDILEAMLRNSEEPACSGGVIPQDAEGPLFLDLGTFDAGTSAADLSGAPVDWPMTIMDLFQLLVGTGQLDAVITYTDTTTAVRGIVDGYPGNYGQDLSASVDLDYGQGQYSVGALRWNRDMTNTVNKYWIYGGPQISTAADPAGDQHWCFNVTGDDPFLQYPPGGELPGVIFDNPLGYRRVASQADYGVRMKIDIFDAYDDDCIPGFGTPGRELYRYQWQTYSWIAAMPREIIHVTPVDDRYLGCFGIGDQVGVSATALAKGGFSGTQRVFAYTVSWDATPSLLTLSEILTSADAEVGS